MEQHDLHELADNTNAYSLITNVALCQTAQHVASINAARDARQYRQQADTTAVPRLYTLKKDSIIQGSAVNVQAPTRAYMTTFKLVYVQLTATRHWTARRRWWNTIIVDCVHATHTFSTLTAV